MRRVAVVYDSFFPLDAGGGERLYRAICDDLISRGVAVDYVTRAQPGLTSDDGITMIPVVTGPVYDDAGVRRASTAAQFAWGAFAAVRRMRRTHSLVFASALPVLTLLACRLALLGSRTTLVADWLEIWTLRQWTRYSGVVTGTIAFVLQWIGIHSTSVHTADSRFTAARLRRYRRKAQVEVLGLVDLAGEERQRHDPAAPPHVIVIGRLISDKQVPLVIPAVVRARQTIPDLTLLIVGDGPERGAVEATVSELSADAFVRVAGRVDDDELTRQLAIATVHVSASRREGFGLVVAEAAAAGVPSVVVEGQDNAAVHLIEEGVNGFVAATADAEDLADAIVTVWRRGQALRDSTAAWFRHAREEESISTSVERLVQLARR